MKETDTSIDWEKRTNGEPMDRSLQPPNPRTGRHIYSGLDSYTELSLLGKHAMRCPRFDSSKVRSMVCISSERTLKDSVSF
jgi:hypothetical protein